MPPIAACEATTLGVSVLTALMAIPVGIAASAVLWMAYSAAVIAWRWDMMEAMPLAAIMLACGLILGGASFGVAFGVIQ